MTNVRAAISALVGAAAADSCEAADGNTSWASGIRAEAPDATMVASAPARATVRLIWVVALSMDAGSRTVVRVP